MSNGQFDLQEGRLIKQADMPDSFFAADEEPMKKKHRLDSDKMCERHKRLLGIFQDELARQATNRAEQAKDEDFYDGIQWREEDAAILRDRGQVPLVYNVIATSINWIIGTEKRGRTDYKILPRRKDAGKQATRKTQLMKYLSDINQSPFMRSSAFEDSVKVGVGWLETGVQGAEDGEPVYDRYESWRNMLWDSASTEKNLSDCRYLFRFKWVDLDIAIAMFPDREGTLRAAAVAGNDWEIDDYGDDASDSQERITEQNHYRNALNVYKRYRVRIIEAWHKVPETVQKLRGGDFNGEIFDPQNPDIGHKHELDSGRAQLITQPKAMRMNVSLLCIEGMLWDGKSPYRHNSFPFTPIWCYRRGRDKLPYGVIRNLRDMQEDINKRASKALHILSTNKVIMDEGAVDDLEEFREEVARPDGIIIKKQGKQLELNAERELAAPHLELMSRSIAMIQQVSGVTDESLGRTTNATSGRAISARQEQGSLATAPIFDNLRLAVLLHGEKQLSAIEQFYTEEKQFRITNTRGTPSYETINDGEEENDILRSKADFIISETDWRNTVRQAQTEELFGLLQQLAPVAPQLALVMMDLLVEGMDVPSREELVARIRQATGMRDPDAEEPTPEELAAEQAKKQQAELQQRAQLAIIAKDEAAAAVSQTTAQRNMVTAAKDQAQTQQILAVMAGQNVNSQKAALEAALTALQAPAAADVADNILHEAGYVSRSEGEETNRQAGIMQAEQQQEQAAAEQAAADQAMMQQQQQQGGMGLPPQQ